MSGDWFSRFFDMFGIKLGLWVGLLMVGVHWFRAKSERMRDRVDEKGNDWTRLRAEITRLDERCDHLQREVDECRAREGEWMSRAIAAEGQAMAAGEARQVAQRIISAERAVTLPKPKT
ncbi:MAG: hypothetical protein ACJ8FS_16360 [Sphingomicrobium sp.]